MPVNFTRLIQGDRLPYSDRRIQGPPLYLKGIMEDYMRDTAAHYVRDERTRMKDVPKNVEPEGRKDNRADVRCESRS